MRKNYTYVEVTINFVVGPTVAEDERVSFCMNTASERKAAEFAGYIARERGGVYAGHAQRKDKRELDKRVKV